MSSLVYLHALENGQTGGKQINKPNPYTLFTSVGKVLSTFKARLKHLQA